MPGFSQIAQPCCTLPPERSILAATFLTHLPGSAPGTVMTGTHCGSASQSVSQNDSTKAESRNGVVSKPPESRSSKVRAVVKSGMERESSIAISIVRLVPDEDRYRRAAA